MTCHVEPCCHATKPRSQGLCPSRLVEDERPWEGVWTQRFLDSVPFNQVKSRFCDGEIDSHPIQAQTNLKLQSKRSTSEGTSFRLETIAGCSGLHHLVTLFWKHSFPGDLTAEQLGVVESFYFYVANENSSPSSLPGGVAFREKDAPHRLIFMAR